MNIKDEEKLRGRFHLRRYEKGSLVNEIDDHNLIVTGARIQMAHLVAGDNAGRHITTVQVGTSGDPATVDDTEITEPFETEITSVEYPEFGQVKFNWGIGTSEANGKAIREFGLMCQDGTLFARFVLQEPINKASVFALEGDWTIEF